jgi:nucleotide-binding universal stress UspA family protein
MEMLEPRLANLDGIDAQLCVKPRTSPAKVLHAVAAHESAELIVIGSSHRGALGRVFAGTTAERLLHGSPCPVAVAPKGFAAAERGGIKTIVVGYDGSDESKAALAATTSVARALSAAIRVVRVFEPPYPNLAGAAAGAAYYRPVEEIEREARAKFEAAIAALANGDAIDTVFVVGDPVTELVGRSHAADLIVVGSRGYGPHRAVLLGSVSGRLVREAACPVIAIPRGVDAHFDKLFAEPTATVAAGSGKLSLDG